MEAARNHGIDAILVKSVSRFARNTADSLRYTRELTDMEVSVYFEKERYWYILFWIRVSAYNLCGFFAQEESHSISENIKRGLRNRYRFGEVPWYTVYSYRKGSVIVSTLTASCPAHTIRNKELEKGKNQNYIWTDDILFASLSKAACFVTGASANGNTEWKTEGGIALKNLDEQWQALAFW